MQLEGDILKSDAEGIVVPTVAFGDWNESFAARVAAAWPRNADLVRDARRAGLARPGTVISFATGRRRPPFHLLTFVLEERPDRLDDGWFLARSAVAIIRRARLLQLRTLAIPRLGVEPERSRWDLLVPRILARGERVGATRLLVFASPAEVALRRTPVLTPELAALFAVLGAYLDIWPKREIQRPTLRSLWHFLCAAGLSGSLRLTWATPGGVPEALSEFVEMIVRQIEPGETARASLLGEARYFVPRLRVGERQLLLESPAATRAAERTASFAASCAKYDCLEVAYAIHILATEETPGKTGQGSKHDSVGAYRPSTPQLKSILAIWERGDPTRIAQARGLLVKHGWLEGGTRQWG